MTQQVHNTVFISYRRSTSSYLARAIYMDLKAHGYDVFMDVQSIDSGQFDAIILRQIEARAHFLLLCTPGTFDRINDPGDWLRREIEHAMLHKRNIVPIMASDFKFDAATTQRFAGKLAELPRYNALNAPHDYFEEALERLRTRFLKLQVGVEIAVISPADSYAVKIRKFELESQPPPTIEQLTAEQYFHHGFSRDKTDYEGKIADYTEAINRNPSYVVAFFNRANAYKAIGQLEKAIADHNTAIKLDPNYSKPYNNRAVIRNLQGNYELAIVDSSRAIQLDPINPYPYDTRAEAYEKQGNYEAAIMDYETYLKLGGAGKRQRTEEIKMKISELKYKVGK